MNVNKASFMNQSGLIFKYSKRAVFNQSLPINFCSKTATIFCKKIIKDDRRYVFQGSFKIPSEPYKYDESIIKVFYCNIYFNFKIILQ